MNKEFYGVGIMGLGTVGSGTAQILLENKSIIGIRKEKEIRIVRVLEKYPEKAVDFLNAHGGDSSLVTDDFDEFMTTENMDIVVEVIGGTTIAKEYIIKAIKAGKSVVTANKDLMAIAGGELLALAEENGVDLKFEAAVAGGIPIINVIKNDLAANNISSVMGIINGTTNYILTRMLREGVDYTDCLADAQRLGFAEADPTADVGGLDAARKIAILASVAFNSRVTFDDVYVEGIQKISQEDIAAAKKLGYCIKLLGIAHDVNGKIEARVHPVMIPFAHPLSSVNDTYNAVYVVGDAVGETMFYGRGAGDLYTGSAVVSDICRVVENYKNNTLAAQGCTCYFKKEILPREEFESKFYIRMTVKDSPGVLAFISRVLGDNQVSIASVIQKKADHEQADLIIITHHVKEGAFMKAEKELLASDVVYGITNIIRVEE